jgi:hypothetical protein
MLPGLESTQFFSPAYFSRVGVFNGSNPDVWKGAHHTFMALSFKLFSTNVVFAGVSCLYNGISGRAKKRRVYQGQIGFLCFCMGAVICRDIMERSPKHTGME